MLGFFAFGVDASNLSMSDTPLQDSAEVMAPLMGFSHSDVTMNLTPLLGFLPFGDPTPLSGFPSIEGPDRHFAPT